MNRGAMEESSREGQILTGPQFDEHQADKERGPQCLQLANTLSALYPRGSEEKRPLNAMPVAI